uniref:EGF-like domain-containing protein n=1 Tax=Caenorhabditis japonica TaxID=281687 RepID=A0A8R1DLQ9_CAEJA
MLIRLLLLYSTSGPTLKQKCRGGGECRGQGEFCSSFSICMCLSTHVDVGSQCKPVVYPGQHGCEDSIQCNKGFPGANCDVHRNCVCPVGLIAIQQTCVANDGNIQRAPIRKELMLQNEIMADHRKINRSDFRGNFFRRRNYDGPRALQIGPDFSCSYDNQCAGYPLAICDSVCKCVKGALNTGFSCIASTTALQSSVQCPTGQTYIREAGVCMTVQQPGEPCQYSQQCSALEPGAYCLKMRCECVYGMKKSSNGCTFVNNDCKERGHIFISEIGECREVIPPGGKGCSHNLQCSGAYPDATCFMQTCTCPPNLPVAADGTCGRSCPDKMIYSGVTGECLPEKQPGQDCIYSSQCQAAFGGLICDKNTCRCPNGLVFDGMKCSQSCPPHRRLIEKEICVESCEGSLVEVQGRCVAQVAIGQPCSANAQCNFGSFCQSGTCQCPPGFYVVDSKCEAIESDPNGSCQNNEKCTKGSVCYNGKCTCPRNHELINGYCQPNRAAVKAYNTALNNIRKIRLRFASQSKSRNTPQLTNTISNNDDNESLVPIGSACVRIGVTCDGGSVCVAGICVCPLRTTPRNGICIEQVAARPGAFCMNGEECVENSICNEETHKCECIKPSQMVVGGQCVERLRSHPGYGCSMGEMCVGNSVCVNGRCECTNGKIDVHKICMDPVVARLGDTCGKGIICQGGSYCNLDTGKCACPKGEKEINGECKAVTLAHPGDLCTDVTSRCTGGSYCVRGRCECPLSMHAVDRKCVLQQTAAPGESCTESISCSGLSVCKNNKCTCVNDMYVRDKLCVQRRKIDIGNSCSGEDLCLGNSTCSGKVCQCPAGYVANLNVCVVRKTVPPGYLCNHEDICTGQSVCIKGVCQCRQDYKQVNNMCVKKNIGIEGSPCSSRDDCGEGLTCDSTLLKCTCPDGFFSINGKCRNYIALGQTCTSIDRCAARNSQCQENVCACKTGFVNINGQCSAAIVTPSEPEILSQVKSGLIGHICTTNSHCKILHSHCRRNVCICKDGYRIFGSTQCIPRVAKPKEKKAEKTSKLVELGEICDKFSLCQRGAICNQGVCSCPENFYDRDGVCVKDAAKVKVMVPPLSSCLNGEECSGNSECVHGMCFCKDDYTLYLGKCQKLKIVEKLRVLETKRVVDTHRSFSLTSPTTSPTKLTKTTATLTTTTKSPIDLIIFKSTTTTTNKPSTTTTQEPLTPIKISMKLGTSQAPHSTPNPNYEYKWRPTKCLASNQCPSGAHCVKGECKCKPGLAISRYGFCVPITFAEPGTSCAYGERCQKDSHCEDGMCTCNEPLILKENKCVKSTRVTSSLSMPGDSCQKGLCVGGSTCTNFVCKCPEDYFKQGDSCIRYEARIGAPCGMTTGCSGGSHCSSSYCQCEMQYDADIDECYPNESPVRSRNVNSISGRKKVNRVVSASTVNCPIGYDLVNGMCVNSETLSVIQLAEPGGACEDGRVLCTGNSVCANNVCICPGGETVQNGTCIAANTFSAPGEICDFTNTLCTGNSKCVEGICKCPNNQGAINGKCLNMNSNCGQMKCGTNQICIQEICQCRPILVEELVVPISVEITKFVYKINVSAKRVISSNLTVASMIDAIASNNRFCQTHCRPVNGNVEQTKYVLKINANAKQDTMRNLKHALEIDAIAFQDLQRLRVLVAVVPHNKTIHLFGLPGQMCDLRPDATQCRNQAQCINNYCACPSNRVIYGNDCVVYLGDALPGQRCDGNGLICGVSPGQTCDPNCSYQPCMQRCSGGSSCSNSICTCPQGSYVFNNVCTSNFPQNDNANFTKTARPGDSCDNTIVCIGGSSCIIGTCSCDIGYTPSSDRTSCVLIDRYNVRSRSYPKSFCTFDSECVGGSICVDKRCTCRNDQEMVNGVCQLANQPGSRCHTSFCSKGADCRNGYCVCGKTNYSNSTLDCVPYIGTAPMTLDPLARRTQQPRILTECPRDNSCRLPSCFCTSSGKVPPNNLDPKNIPQMVMLAFDDPITDRIINTLKSLFSGKIRNSNGCAIKGTFFISHQWNNYDQTLWLHSKKHEISVNSITKEDLSGRTKERWYKEQKGMRETLAEFSYVDRSQIVGTRSPLFKIGGDSQFEMMAENNFTYDNSMLVNGAYWPQTLDHKLSWECDGRCPTSSHKGIWEIPVQNIQAADMRWYKTLTRALKPVDSRDSVKKMLMRNFMNHYKTNRAPFVVTLDTEFLTYLPDNGAIYALEDFLKDIVQKPEVFVVTGSQVIDWMKNPVTLNDLKNFRPWQCKFLMNDHVQPCEVPSICSFDGRARGQLAHSFRMCGVCPTSYPWIS